MMVAFGISHQVLSQLSGFHFCIFMLANPTTIIRPNGLKSRRLFSTLEIKQAILEKIQNKFGFVQFEPIIESTLNKPNSSPINTDFMVGLVDGDGSFNF